MGKTHPKTMEWGSQHPLVLKMSTALFTFPTGKLQKIALWKILKESYDK